MRSGIHRTSARMSIMALRGNKAEVCVFGRAESLFRSIDCRTRLL